MIRLLVIGCFVLGVLAGAVVMACSSAPSTTDPVCKKALDAAEVVIGRAMDAMDAVGEAIDAYISGNGEALLKANDKINALADKVGPEADEYRRLAGECRSNG